MSLRTTASLAVAIVMGLFSMLMLRGYLVAHAQPQQTAELAPVVVATGPIARGATLNGPMMKVAYYPRASVPDGAYTSVDQVLRGGGGGPRRALRDVVTNEPLVVTKLSGPGAPATLAGVLKPGMRAVSVKSTDVSGVGGFILPGDRVDVLVTRQVGSGQNVSSLVQALADDVRVLGVDQSADADKPTVAKAVTVEVTPDQAQAISLAQAVGSVTLSLRQSNDGTPLSRRAMTIADLGPTRPAPARHTRLVHAALPQVHVTRGVNVAAYSVAD